MGNISDKLNNFLGLGSDTPEPSKNIKQKKETIMAKVKKLVATSSAAKPATVKKKAAAAKPEKALKTTVKTVKKAT